MIFCRVTPNVALAWAVGLGRALARLEAAFLTVPRVAAIFCSV